MSNSPEVVISAEPADRVASDVLLVGATCGEEGPAPLTGSELVIGPEVVEGARRCGFKGELGEVVLVPAPPEMGPRAIALAGLGPGPRIGPSEVMRAAGAAGRRLGGLGDIVSVLHLAGVDSGGSLTKASVEGLLLGSYRFTRYKTGLSPSGPGRIILPGGNEDAAKRGRVIAEGVCIARDLINEPASTITPAQLAEAARIAAEAGGLECEVWDESELAERGFGGVIGVGQGSEEPPRLIQLTYRPEDPAARIILVGKGVTYDTGGYSLKPAASMEQMKTDMSGAAAVIAAITVIARLGSRCEVRGIIPATENMVSGRSVKPGDVLRHYGGKTTEVTNTDAEGRLILADCLAFASEQAPDAIVDIATLTSSIVIGLGRKGAGLFGTDEALKNELQAAGARAGERIWPMPLWDDYRSELESGVADQKNVGSRFGGPIIAALFLRSFVRDDIPWAHLDIAGPARAESDYDEITKGGTGFGVRTLVEWICNRGG